MDQLLRAYIPSDRRVALARGETLPDRCRGAALFADISGFTALTESLARQLGPQRGAEELTYMLNRVYEALVAEVDRFGGSVIMFSGDSITCWFDDDTSLLAHPAEQPGGAATARAIACGLGMQADVGASALAGELPLAIKVAVAYGPARRFLVGDPQIQRVDVLAGSTLDRLADAEQLAAPGEVVLDAASAARLGSHIVVQGWRGQADGPRVSLVSGLAEAVAPCAWPELAPNAISDDVARQWLLKPVAARLQQRADALLADLRPALALFLSFGGIDYDGDDDAGILLDAYVRHVQLTLARYEGFLLQVTIGDKGSYIYASFGAPIAHDDDAARAIAAAQELRAPPSQLGFISGVRIGLAQGQMYAGSYGGTSSRIYGVLGDKTNLAARLMALADIGAVWCDEMTYRRARRAWRFEALPPTRVKGKSDLVRVYRPLTKLSAAGHLHEPAAADWPVPAQLGLIGRAAELDRLARSLDHLRAGLGQLVLIEGEAGLGKSRLLAELIEQARVMQLPVLLGAGLSIEQQTPYRAWREIFGAYFELDAPSEPAEWQARVLRLVQEAAPKLLPRLPLLNDLLNLDFADTPLTAALDPSLRRESLAGLLTGLLRASAQRQPLLVVIEDAHWLDSLSWGLALQVARAMIGAGEPILLVLTYRPIEEHSVGAQPLAALRALADDRSITLGALSAGEILEVAAMRLGIPVAAVPGPVAKLLQRSGGNPFFAEELIAALRERQLITIEAEPDGPARCLTAGNFDMAGAILPDTLQELILARIDQLPPDWQLALKVAAVIGYSFGYSPLSATLHRYTNTLDLELRKELEHLARQNFTDLEALEPELTYIFKHIIIQEVAYETLLFSQRQQIHRLVAEWYERLYGDDSEREGQPPGDRRPDTPASSARFSTLSPYFPLLAHHYRQAGDRDRERRYARLAGERAAAQFASTEALAYLSRALDLTPGHEPAERYALLRTREQVYDLQGARAAQERDLEALAALAEALDDNACRAEVTYRRSMHATATSNYPRATALAEQAVQLAQPAGAAAVEAMATVQWGRALLDEAIFEPARAQLTRGVTLARQAGLPGVAADCLVKLGLLSQTIGDYTRAVGEYRQALDLSQQVGDRLVEGKALVGIGQVEVSQGSYEPARARFQEALAIFRTVGDRRRESWAHSMLGDLAVSLGDYGAAEDSYRDTLAIARAIGDRYAESHALNFLGLILQNQGSYAAAGECYAQALAIAPAIGNRWVESGVLANRGLLLHQQGDSAAALEHGRQALQIALAIGYRRNQAFAWTLQGHALLQLERPAEAASAYEQALAIWRELGEHNLAPDPLAGLARAALAAGDQAGAQAYAEEILAHLKTKLMDGAGEPILNYLTCYAVLSANDDPRAHAVLADGYALLSQRAEQLAARGARASFLEQVPAHRRLAALAREQGMPARPL